VTPMPETFRLSEHFQSESETERQFAAKTAAACSGALPWVLKRIEQQVEPQD
jgi:hypothetical protein